MTPFLTAEWRDLIAINYEVPPDILSPLLPRETQLDLWQEKALVSLVAFRFIQTRVHGISIPFHTNFEEVNLRFYVNRIVDGNKRRGVVFIKEVVPRLAIAIVARMFYGENYHAVSMSHSIEHQEDAKKMLYYWREKQRDHYIAATVSGDPTPMKSSTESEFIFEHYWGYSKTRKDQTIEYEVCHPPWIVWENCETTIHVDFERVYGTVFAPHLIQNPHSSFVAVGSEIAVHKGRYIS